MRAEMTFLPILILATILTNSKAASIDQVRNNSKINQYVMMRMKQIHLALQAENACCTHLKIIHGQRNEVYEKYKQLFTVYSYKKEKKAYLSRDNNYAIAVCDSKYMIQKRENL